jgi:hypothetical protein
MRSRDVDVVLNTVGPFFRFEHVGYATGIPLACGPELENERGVTMRFLLVLTLLVPTVSFAASGDKEILETITLQPKEKKEISVDSTEKIKLGWDHTETEKGTASRCQKMCVMMTKQGSESGVASMHGMSIGIVPIDGKVAATFENVEDFPIEIEIFKK